LNTFHDSLQKRELSADFCCARLHLRRIAFATRWRCSALAKRKRHKKEETVLEGFSVVLEPSAKMRIQEREKWLKFGSLAEIEKETCATAARGGGASS
jgi:hypothetical protein